MQDPFRWLSRLFLFWMGWWFTTVAVSLGIFSIPGTNGWRAAGIVALMFFSGGYGTVMLIRCFLREVGRVSPEE